MMRSMTDFIDAGINAEPLAVYNEDYSWAEEYADYFNEESVNYAQPILESSEYQFFGEACFIQEASKGLLAGGILALLSGAFFMIIKLLNGGGGGGSSSSGSTSSSSSSNKTNNRSNNNSNRTLFGRPIPAKTDDSSKDMTIKSIQQQPRILKIEVDGNMETYKLAGKCTYWKVEMGSVGKGSNDVDVRDIMSGKRDFDEVMSNKNTRLVFK